MKIKVRKINKSLQLPKFIENGDWVDLRAACSVQLSSPFANTLTNGRTRRTVEFDDYKIPLGIAMKLPNGFEAIVAPRSSSFGRYGILQTNSIGVIDSLYSGNNDEWKLPVISTKDVVIEEGDRICQFRIQLSQKATVWQRLKWLFSSKIEIVEVDNLNSEDRDGFGSTGVQS